MPFWPFNPILRHSLASRGCIRHASRELCHTASAAALVDSLALALWPLSSAEKGTTQTGFERAHRVYKPATEPKNNKIASILHHGSKFQQSTSGPRASDTG